MFSTEVCFVFLSISLFVCDSLKSEYNSTNSMNRDLSFNIAKFEMFVEGDSFIGRA